MAADMLLLLLPAACAVPLPPGERIDTLHFDPERQSPNLRRSNLHLDPPVLSVHPTLLRIRNNVNMSDTGYLWPESWAEGVYNETDPEWEQNVHRVLDRGQNVTYERLLRDQPHGRSPGVPGLADHPYPDFRNRLLCPDCKEMMLGMKSFCRMRFDRNARDGRQPDHGRDDIEDFCDSNFLPANGDHKIGIGMARDTHGSHAFTGTKFSECRFLVDIVKNHTCEPCNWVISEPWNYGVPEHKRMGVEKEVCFGPHAGVVKKVVGGYYDETGNWQPNEVIKCAACVDIPPPLPTRIIHEECVLKPRKFDWGFCIKSIKKLENFCVEHKPKRTPEDFHSFCDYKGGPMDYDSVIAYNECKDWILAVMVHFHPANPCFTLHGCPPQEVCPIGLPACPKEMKGWSQDLQGNPVLLGKSAPMNMSKFDEDISKTTVSSPSAQGTSSVFLAINS